MSTSDSEFAVAVRTAPSLAAAVRRSLQGRFGEAVALDAEYGGQARLSFRIDIDSSAQVYRVAQTLARVDLAVRRACAGFVSRPHTDGYYRPMSPLVSGLVFESVDIASYHGRHALHGQSLPIGARYPITLALVAMIAGNATSAYVVPHLPGQSQPDRSPWDVEVEIDLPTVPPGARGAPASRGGHELDLRIRENSPLNVFRGPPGSPGGVPALVTVVIDGPGGRVEVSGVLRPGPPRP